MAQSTRSHVWPFGQQCSKLFPVQDGPPFERYGLDKDWLSSFPFFPGKQLKPQDDWGSRGPPVEWRDFSPRFDSRKSPLTKVDDEFVKIHMHRSGTAPSLRRYPEYYARR